VVEFLERVCFLVVLLLGVGAVECLLDFVAPVVEDSLEIGDHVLAEVFGGVDIFDLVFPSWIVWVQSDVVGQALQRLSQLNAETVEDLGELLLLLVGAFTPVVLAQLVDHRLVDLVDDRVQGRYRVL